MNYSEQILKARFEQLPEDIREAIMATPWEEKLKEISDKHNLHIDQAGHLGEETVLVMFGIEHADNLIPNIAKHVEVTEEEAEAIAEDLDQEIFLKVRESLKKMFEEREEEESSFLGGSLLGKTGEKTDEEELDREKILREIEDKEHHNFPSTNKTELHLEIPLPYEIAEKSTQPADTRLNSQNIDTGTKAKNLVETSIPAEQIKKKISELQPDALRTMEKDILKAKMGGTVNVPKEVVEIKDVASEAKPKITNVGKKIDPYRERIGE